MNKKYFIFDFDGTLVNTNDIIIESWQATFEHYLGHKLPVRDILATFGETIFNSMERMLPDADPEETVEYYRKYQDEHQDEEKVYVFEGVADVLRELRSRGCIIGIGTSRTESSFRKYMEMLGLNDLVDEIVTINDVSVHKPDPETINAVLVKMMAHDGWPCSEAAADKRIPDEVRDAAVMVGDTKYDVGCANNAGVDAVLVGWSHYVDEEQMAAEGFEPAYRMDTPDQLLDLV
ncbi:MAG: HAD hydrolase-like protein [Mogibacterium sp.]|nr:HAD hydrolase-like protein [Mogibacterium sp.]